MQRLLIINCNAAQRLLIINCNTTSIYIYIHIYIYSHSHSHSPPPFLYKLTSESSWLGHCHPSGQGPVAGAWEPGGYTGW